jgi:hypothetical protein
MSFASTSRIPYLTTYAQAKEWHDRVQPIRRVTPELRPLAGRRDKHMQIRENAQGDIECVLYETPAVVFKKTGTVTVSPGKCPSAYTCSFISNVLPHIHGRTTRGNLVIQIADKEYPLKKDMTIELSYKSGWGWSAVEATGVHEWKPNRKKANNVRANYAEFLKYYKGLMSMMSETVDNADDTDMFAPKNYVRMQHDLVRQVLGTRTLNEPRWLSGKGQDVTIEVANMDDWKLLKHKPTWSEANTQASKDWRDAVIKMQVLMHNDQPQGTKHENFLKAAVVLFSTEVSGHHTGLRMNNGSATLSKSKAMELANDFIMRVHAEEIMERVMLPVGKVPTDKYANYLFGSFRKEQGEKI